MPASSFFRLFLFPVLVPLTRLRRMSWTPNRVWVGIFAFWIFLLSGLTYELGAGSPGILQFSRLRGLLTEKRQQLAGYEVEIEKIEKEGRILETSAVAQEREIRKTMGYVGEGELIFDFSSSQSAALRR
jgi:cell division protein FtsB